jgi:hypothetical protein
LLKNGPAIKGINDLCLLLESNFGVRVKAQPTSSRSPRIAFMLRDCPPKSRWDSNFHLQVNHRQIAVEADSEIALLRASLHLSNYWRLRRSPSLALGRRTVHPAVPIHLGADLWGGFSTTQAWVKDRENDDNFLEIARMGVNAVPVMTLLEDYIEAVPDPRFRSLVNPQARFNRERLAKLARQSAQYGVFITLMAYNPKLPPDHRVFHDYPGCAGALQRQGAVRTLCSSDAATREFLAESWASLFRKIPELGGLLAIVGGEGFYHCFMSSAADQMDCPRCSKRNSSQMVAELVNAVARGVRAVCPDAFLIAWPYSATHWSHDRDQVELIRRLDPQCVIFQTELDKDSVDWRKAGYAKDIWDYSASVVQTSDRCHSQRRLAGARGLPFSVKIECNSSIECLSVPYLPVVENQTQIWENCRRLRPRAIHSRWLFDGSCKAPPEEIGYWAIWGRGTEFEDLRRVARDIARREFGNAATPYVVRAWKLFSEAMRHHPSLHYYTGSYYIGPGQPLVLDPDPPDSSLDPVFFGAFYWQWEGSPTRDAEFLVKKQRLFFAKPAFRALARRGPRRGEDVGLQELQALARLWERGLAELEKARRLVPPCCRRRFEREFVLGKHLALTWRSAANVEEFLRLRDVLREFTGAFHVRAGHFQENLRDLHRLTELAQEELRIAREDRQIIRNADFLDLSLRLDMGTASQVDILKSKIKQVRRLLRVDLPALRGTIGTW